MARSGFYRAIADSVTRFNDQLNINAARDAERKRRGIQTMMANAELQERGQMMRLREEQEERAAQAHNVAMAAAEREKQDWEMQEARKRKEAEDFRISITPAVLNVVDYLGGGAQLYRTVADDADARYDIGSHLGTGLSIDKTGVVIDAATGKPHPMAPRDLVRALPGMMGAAEQYVKPERQLAQKMDSLKTQYKEAKTDLQKLVKLSDPTGLSTQKSPAIIEAKERVANIAAKAAELNRNPYQLLREGYEQKINRLMSLIPQAQRFGASPATMAVLSSELDSTHKMLQKIAEQETTQKAGQIHTMKKAVRDDGSVFWVTIPKTMAGQALMSPADVANDERLAGAEWYDSDMKGKPRKLTTVQGRIMSKYYHKDGDVYLQDATKEWVHDYAQKFLEHYYDTNPKMNEGGLFIESVKSAENEMQELSARLLFTAAKVRPKKYEDVLHPMFFEQMSQDELIMLYNILREEHPDYIAALEEEAGRLPRLEELYNITQVPVKYQNKINDMIDIKNKGN